VREFGHAVVDRCCDAAERVGARLGWMVDAGGEAGAAAFQRLRRLCRNEPLPRRPLVVVAVAVIFGCFVGPWLLPGEDGRVVGIVAAWWLAAVSCLGGWWWMFNRRRNDAIAATLLVAAIGCTAAGWAVARHRLFAADDLAWSLGDTPAPVMVEGVVSESPRLLTSPAPDPLRTLMLGPSSECVITIEAVRDGAAWRPATGRAAVVADGSPPPLPAGSRVRVLGRGVRPAPAANPGEFDFRERARLLRCLSIVRCHGEECLEVVGAPPLLSIVSFVDRVRAGGIDVLRRHLSKSRAPLAAALLLGSRESLPAEESREFLVTGTIHILSISGLHVGLLAIGLFAILRMVAMPRGWALVTVAVCTGLYMLLVRAETPVLRATLLVWLSCLGAALGRRSLAINALAAAAIIVLAWHPPELFRVGSQLSFLSTAVLIGAAAMLPAREAHDDPIERLIERSRGQGERRLRRYVRQAAEMVAVGAAIWAVTAPIVAARFHVVSPVGLALNPIIAPLVPLAMIWGFLCLAVAPVSTLLAGLFGGLCDATLRCIEAIVGWAAGLPGAYAWVAGPPSWWVVGWYLLVPAMLVALAPERLKRAGTWAMAAAAWIGIGFVVTTAAALLFPYPLEMKAIVAAMGHGCGIVVRSPTGKVLVYDAGRLGAPGAARRGMAAVLWSEGVSRIDSLVISHPDTDHFNAVPELLERFRVAEVVVSPAFLRSESAAVAEVVRRIHALQIPIRTVAAGDAIPCDSLCRIRVLHPVRREEREEMEQEHPASDNETSLVLAVESAGRRLLLTGDLEGNGLQRFIATDPDSCDVVIAPHHGSGTSLPPDLARVTRPDWVVVSGVGGRRWAEVRQAYEAARDDGRPSTVIKTGGDGAIKIGFNADRITVEQWKGGRWQPVAPRRGNQPASVFRIERNSSIGSVSRHSGLPARRYQ
jgi:competence protein ComEC